MDPPDHGRLPCLATPSYAGRQGAVTPAAWPSLNALYGLCEARAHCHAAGGPSPAPWEAPLSGSKFSGGRVGHGLPVVDPGRLGCRPLCSMGFLVARQAVGPCVLSMVKVWWPYEGTPGLGTRHFYIRCQIPTAYKIYTHHPATTHQIHE